MESASPSRFFSGMIWECIGSHERFACVIALVLDQATYIRVGALHKKRFTKASVRLPKSCLMVLTSFFFPLALTGC
jgi:hypothetical protein